jgi:ABC-type sugar transport system ATPase subunit
MVPDRPDLAKVTETATLKTQTAQGDRPPPETPAAPRRARSDRTRGGVTLIERQRASRSVYLNGREVPASVRQALDCGVTLLPEDRVRWGLNLRATMGENVSFSALPAVTRRGRLTRKRELAFSADVLRWYSVVPPDPTPPVAQLSGGNQQKSCLPVWPRAAPGCS